MSSSTSFGTGTMGSGALGSSPFANVSEIIDNILYTTGHGSPSQETTKRRAILAFINNRYQEVCLGRHWKWLQASYDFQLEAPYETGTAVATQGDATVTGTGTAFSANITRKNVFFFNSSNVVYHVASVASATSLELETEFAEDTISTAESFTIGQNQYVLSSTTDNILSFVVNSDTQMVPMGIQDFRYLQSRNPTATGCPKYYSLVRRDTDDDSVYVEVFPTPDQAYQAHIDYTVRILKLADATTCYPIIPDRYRAVLYYGPLADFAGVMLRKNDIAQVADAEYRNFLRRMENDYQLTDSQMIFTPARNYRKSGLVRRLGVTMTAEEFGREE